MTCTEQQCFWQETTQNNLGKHGRCKLDKEVHRCIYSIYTARTIALTEWDPGQSNQQQVDTIRGGQTGSKTNTLEEGSFFQNKTEKNGNSSFSSCNLDENIFIRNDSASIGKKKEFHPKTVFPFKKACLMHSLCTCSAVVHYHGCTVTQHLHKASIALPLSISISITHTQTHTQTNTLSHLGTCAKLHIQDNKQGQS